MKRLSVLLLAVLLMVGMCACGAKPEDIVKVDDSTVNVSDNRADYDKGVAYVEKTLDVSKMTVSTQDESDGQELYCSWSPDSGTQPIECVMDITIGDQQITIGKTLLKEAKEMGFTYKLDVETIEADMNYGITLEKDGKWINAEIGDNTGSAQKGEDLPINGISAIAESEITADAMPFDYCGIKAGDKLEDVVKALGAPNEDVSFNAGGAGCTIELRYGNDNTSISVNFKYDPATDSATLTGMSINLY